MALEAIWAFQSPTSRCLDNDHNAEQGVSNYTKHRLTLQSSIRGWRVTDSTSSSSRIFSYADNWRFWP